MSPAAPYHGEFPMPLASRSTLPGGSIARSPSTTTARNAPGMSVMDFLRAQLVWDATMADSVADALKAGHEPVALVIGRFHVGFDGATVEYIRRTRPGADVLTIVIVDSWSDELAEEDRGRGDIVIYAGPIDRGEPAGASESED